MMKYRLSKILRRLFNCVTPLFIVCLLLQGGISSCSATDCVEGNGHVVEQVRQIAGIQSVNVSGPFDVLLTVGVDESLVVSADKNLLPFLTTTTRGEELLITTSRSVCSENPMEIRLSVRHLTSVSSDGASDFKITGVDGQILRLHFAGASDISVAGDVDNFTVVLSGASDLDAAGLRADRAKVTISGSAEARINVKDSLDAEITGVGDIYFLGNPTITIKDQTGLGEVLPLVD